MQFDSIDRTWIQGQRVFRINSSIMEELPSAQISRKIREEFNCHKRPLTPDAIIKVKLPGKIWEISGMDTQGQAYSYLLTKEQTREIGVAEALPESIPTEEVAKNLSKKSFSAVMNADQRSLFYWFALVMLALALLVSGVVFCLDYAWATTTDQQQLRQQKQLTATTRQLRQQKQLTATTRQLQQQLRQQNQRVQQQQNQIKTLESQLADYADIRKLVPRQKSRRYAIQAIIDGDDRLLKQAWKYGNNDRQTLEYIRIFLSAKSAKKYQNVLCLVERKLQSLGNGR